MIGLLIRYCCVFLIFSFAQSSWAQAKWDTIPKQPDHYRKKVELFNQEKTKTDRLVFLGNSITEGGDWKRLAKDTTAINRGISGDITFGLLARVDEVASRKPSKVFILIGVNDLSKGIPDEVILQNIFLLVRQLQAKSPTSKIYVQSILPVNPSFDNFPKDYDKLDHILVINAQLQKIAERFGYTYIDLFEKFKDSEGLLDKRFSYDGLHLSAQGYLLWGEVLRNLKLIK
ncbi:MAG: sialate O-acetylesterase [Flammeovirgaceae bacterium]|nr:sialate O-acetylesterase [Flammeovirgaceae bacterium]